MGINAFRTRCSSCGAKLKGDAATWAGLLFALLVFVLWLAASGPLLHTLGLDGVDLATRAAVVIPFMFVAAVVVWSMGGYVEWQPASLAPPEDAMPSAAPKRVDRIVVVFLLAAAIFFFVAPLTIVITGFDDLALLAFGVGAEAHVVSAEQMPGFLRRQGDWRITYEFRTDAGVWRDTDVLPPALMSAGLRSIAIEYVRWRPSMSRIESQVSGTPVLAAVILLAFLIGVIRDLATG